MKSTATMTEAMKGATRAMMAMNRQVNMPAMQHIMMEFEKQGEIMEMKVQAYYACNTTRHLARSN